MRKIIVPIEFNHSFGGMQKSILTLLLSLKEQYDITVVTPIGSDIKSFFEEHGFRVIQVYNEEQWRIRRALGLINIFRLRREVKKLLDDDSILLTNNITSEVIFGLFGKIKNEQRVFISRGGDYKGVSRLLLRLSLKSAGDIVSISKKQAGVVKNDLGFKSEVINNPILNYQIENIQRDKLIISNIGHFCERKNQMLLVDSFDVLVKEGFNNIAISFYGNSTTPEDEAYEKKLKEHIENKGLSSKITFKGYEKSVENIFNNTDIVVSTALEEGFGRTIAEGLIFNKPVVAMNCAGGPKDIINDRVTGWLIENSKNELAKALREIIMEPNSKIIIENGHKYAKEQFSLESISEKYQLVFNKR